MSLAATMSWGFAPARSGPPPMSPRRRCRAASDRCSAPPSHCGPPNPACRRSTAAAAAQFLRQPARHLVAVDLRSPVRRIARLGIHRQRPADRRVVQGRAAVSVCGELPREQVRGLPRHHQFSRPGEPRRDQRQWLDDLAADPLLLRHRRQQPAGAGPRAANLDDGVPPTAAPATRRRTPIPTASPATSTGSAPTTPVATCWRACSMASASQCCSAWC